jgi:hypothetical protein
MYLMFGDEADADQGRGQKFFIYGGVFIDTSETEELHHAIQRRRKKFGYAATDSLKFSDCPKGITLDQHRELKKEIVRLARKHDVVFCAYAISHGIAKGETRDNLVLFGANTLLGKYNEFLDEKSDVGVALVDRMSVGNPYQYLKEKFQIGLELGAGTRRLENVIGYASTCDGASHLASMADILVGSFRHCVNEPERDIANAAIFPTLVRVMWHRDMEGGTKTVMEYGLTLRPEKVQVEAHRKDYDDLTKRLAGYMETQDDALSPGAKSSTRQRSQMAEFAIAEALRQYKPLSAANNDFPASSEEEPA